MFDHMRGHRNLLKVDHVIIHKGMLMDSYMHCGMCDV